MSEKTRITDITVTKKGRYALFCDGEFLFSIDEETYLRHHIKIDDELDRESLEQLRAASDYFSAKNKALELLGYRDHSSRELYDKLRRKFDEQTSEGAVAKMRELGLVDDASFATKLASELIENGKQSRRAASAKLYEKGISKELIAAALEGYDEDETENVRAVIEKKYLSKLRNGKREAVTAALARLGFRLSDIKKALSEYGGEDMDFYG